MAGKILYPIGTQVTVKASKPYLVYFVVDYRKGEKYPYRVSGSENGDVLTVNGKKKFSVKGLKRYNPNLSKKVKEAKQPSMASQTSYQCDMSNYFTKDEVMQLVMTVVDTLMPKVDSVRSDINTVVKLADVNFIRMSRKLKSMSHDDD